MPISKVTRKKRVSRANRDKELVQQLTEKSLDQGSQQEEYEEEKDDQSDNSSGDEEDDETDEEEESEDDAVSNYQAIDKKQRIISNTILTASSVTADTEAEFMPPEAVKTQTLMFS